MNPAAESPLPTYGLQDPAAIMLAQTCIEPDVRGGARPEEKAAILAIWKAAASQTARIIGVAKSQDARKAARLVLLNVSWQIRSLVQGTDEAWESPGSPPTRLAHVITEDLAAIQRELDRHPLLP